MAVKRVQCMLRPSLHYRRDAFLRGLAAHGYEQGHVGEPKPDDVLLIWNRYGGYEIEAQRFERAGARVIVAENGYMGKAWRDRTWFSLALGHHAGLGDWPDGGPGRWDSWGIELAPWRGDEGETVVLGQRGIGEPGIASPHGWGTQCAKRLQARVREHPDLARDGPSLEKDLKRARRAVTWASSAGLHALALGVPVFYGLHGWIGAAAAQRVEHWSKGPRRDDEARLQMFQRLAWAMWTLEEIADGTAFDKLLHGA